MSGHFKDRVTFVSGGASGIGRGLCEELGRRGAAVIVADLDHPGAAAVAAGIEQAGGRAEAIRLDVADQDALRAALVAVQNRHGRLDFVFNNAGIATFGEARDQALPAWRKVLEVDLWAVITGSLAAYELMREQGHGHIVNTASLAGLGLFPGGIPYSVAKWGVVSLSLNLRLEARDLGVRVSTICPGFVQSKIYDNAEAHGIDHQETLRRLPFPRMPTERAVQIILRGVEKNKALIVFPWYAKLLWWLHRLSPTLALEIANLGILRELRKVRDGK